MKQSMRQRKVFSAKRSLTAQGHATWMARQLEFMGIKPMTWADTPTTEFDELIDQVLNPKPTIYVCKKVSDSTEIARFDTRQEALDLVNKHVRGKKAKLQVFDQFDNPVVFLEGE